MYNKPSQFIASNQMDQFLSIQRVNPLLHNNTFHTFEIQMYHVFENIMENGAFALLEQMVHYP